MNFILKNGLLVDPKNKLCKKLDVDVENGVVARVGEGLSRPDAEVIDVTGLFVTPGFVDMHCHLREPGFTYKEDIATGSLSAAFGGFTSIACMPNTNPVIDNAAVAAFVRSRLSYVNVFPIGAVTKNQAGAELADIAQMKREGIVALSEDGKSVCSSSVMRSALAYADDFGLLVISHCEDESLASGGCMNEGVVSTRLGLKGISTAAEEIIVARDIILAKTYGRRIHIAHVSTRGGVEIIRQAKKHGVRVTAETCPHYFSLTEEAVEGFNTLAKVNPPLRRAEDVSAVIDGLKDGTLDAVATDHAPHGVSDKNCDFHSAAFGMVGFETAFSLCNTFLVRAGAISVSELIQKISSVPAEILGINKGHLSVGADADIAVLDPNVEYTVEPEKFHSKSKNCPYGGMRLFGKVVHTVAGGRFVVRDFKQAMFI